MRRYRTPPPSTGSPSSRVGKVHPLRPVPLIDVHQDVDRTHETTSTDLQDPSRILRIDDRAFPTCRARDSPSGGCPGRSPRRYRSRRRSRTDLLRFDHAPDSKTQALDFFLQQIAGFAGSVTAGEIAVGHAARIRDAALHDCAGFHAGHGIARRRKGPRSACRPSRGRGSDDRRAGPWRGCRCRQPVQLDGIEGRLHSGPRLAFGLWYGSPHIHALQGCVPRWNSGSSPFSAWALKLAIVASSPLRVHTDLAREFGDGIRLDAQALGPILAGHERRERIFLSRLAVDDHPAGEVGMGLVPAVDDVDRVIERAIEGFIAEALALAIDDDRMRLADDRQSAAPQRLAFRRPPRRE